MGLLAYFYFFFPRGTCFELTAGIIEFLVVAFVIGGIKDKKSCMTVIVSLLEGGTGKTQGVYSLFLFYLNFSSALSLAFSFCSAVRHSRGRKTTTDAPQGWGLPASSSCAVQAGCKGRSGRQAESSFHAFVPLAQSG